ncbi:hypothetical protein [Phocaeicola sp.]
MKEPEADAPVEIEKGLDGGWYKITYVVGKGYDKRILVEVQPNDTGKERVIPIRIISGNFGCNNRYKQSE